MRLFGALLVFAVALVSGVGSAAGGAYFSTSDFMMDRRFWQPVRAARRYLVMLEIELSGPDTNETGIPTDRGSVHVTYAGICSVSRDGGKVYLKFLIRNDTDQPLAYIGYSANHSFPLLKANGTLLPSAYICSRGTQEFTIPPGRSAEVLVESKEFLSHPQENADISAGFNLRSTPTTESTVHYSEPFTLPEEFWKSIGTD